MRVCKICKEYGIVQPQFKELGNGFKVTLFKLKLDSTKVDTDNDTIITDTEIIDTVKDTAKNTVIDTVKDTEKTNTLQSKIIHENVNNKVVEKVVENLNENQKQILKLIANKPQIAASEIAELIGISSRKTQVNISKLKQKGLLQRIGPDKGGFWQVTKIG